MARTTTGLRPVDDLLGGLQLGDNVVWEVEDDTNPDPFVSAFVRASRKAPALVYVSFRVSVKEVLDRLREEWEPERFLLVDCFTDGVGQGEETFDRFYRTRRARQVRLERIPDPIDADRVQVALAHVERELGPGTRYVFDSLTGMQELWGPDRALSFFLRSCPRLYDLRTVAYWLLERRAHAPSFLSRLKHVTQVVIDLKALGNGQVLKVAKAEGRKPEVIGLEARVTFEDGRIRILRETRGARERIGNLLRAERLARSFTQTELARQIGISPSALSQAERGRSGLSAETLVRAWEALGVPLAAGPGPEMHRNMLTRRGARRITSIARGLSAEDVAATPSGGHLYVLTFAPGASGRRPPFRTKRDEMAMVVAGILEIRTNRANETLQTGDAFVLSSEPLTAWRNPGPEESKVLWCILP